MSTHVYHPSIQEEGLHDGCDRCAEIAAAPIENLDSWNLPILISRVLAWQKDEAFPRSDNELVAMRVIETALRHHAILAKYDGVTA